MKQVIVVKNRWEAQGFKVKYGLSYRKRGDNYIIAIPVPDPAPEIVQMENTKTGTMVFKEGFISIPCHNIIMTQEKVREMEVIHDRE